MYLEAGSATRYRPEWRIAKADFKAAKAVVTSRVPFFEIIRSVRVESPTKLSFATLRRWRGPLNASGHFLVLENQAGQWVIIEELRWIS